MQRVGVLCLFSPEREKERERAGMQRVGVLFLFSL